MRKITNRATQADNPLLGLHLTLTANPFNTCGFVQSSNKQGLQLTRFTPNKARCCHCFARLFSQSRVKFVHKVATMARSKQPFGLRIARLQVCTSSNNRLVHSICTSSQKRWISFNWTLASQANKARAFTSLQKFLLYGMLRIFYKDKAVEGRWNLCLLALIAVAAPHKQARNWCTLAWADNQEKKI